MALGQFHENVTAEQRAQDRFAGGKLEPHVRRAEMEPAFREKINELRAEEGADQRRAVDEHQPPVLARALFPKKKADENAGEQEPGVRRNRHARTISSRKMARPLRCRVRLENPGTRSSNGKTNRVFHPAE